MHIKDPYDYLMPHICFLSTLGQIPVGSGTLVTFSRNKYYAVLTATHVAEELGLMESIEYKLVIISKTIDRYGNLANINLPVGLASVVDNKHFRYLKDNHTKHSKQKFYNFAEKDVTLLFIHPSYVQDIPSQFSFYDLDNELETELLLGNNCYFFRGACTQEEFIDGTLEGTGVYECTFKKAKTCPRSNMKCLVFDSITVNIKGASGASVWLFTKNNNNDIKMSLQGVISGMYSARKELCVISYSYVKNFLIFLVIKRSLIETIRTLMVFRKLQCNMV